MAIEDDLLCELEAQLVEEDRFTRPARLVGHLARVLPGVTLLIAYILLALVNSPAKFLGGADVGGKFATLQAMAANHTFTNPDVGYWAARWDPQGLLHPLNNTVNVGGHWVQATSLPMLLIGEPLFRIGGYRLPLLLPMLGAVACAYGAYALAARLGGDLSSRRLAFWVIGLASPVTIYAICFWEHTIGLALMTWGLVALLDLLSARTMTRRMILGGLAGVAFGLAATMRTEALVYLSIAALLVVAKLYYDTRSTRAGILAAVSFGAGAGACLAASEVFSRWLIGGPLRSARTSGALESAGLHLSTRVHLTLVTTLDFFSFPQSDGIIAGALVATLLVSLAILAKRTDRSRRSLMVGGIVGSLAIMYLVRVLKGLYWVPGMIGAAPLTGIALVTAWRRPRNRSVLIVWAIGILAIPAIGLFQSTNGGGYEWGGRYTLLTMLLLVVVAIVSLPTSARKVTHVLVALSVAITAFGVCWVMLRGRESSAAMRYLDAQPGPLLIAEGSASNLPREAGGVYHNHLWLSAATESDLDFAAQIASCAGMKSFGLVQYNDYSLRAVDQMPSEIGAFRRQNISSTDFVHGRKLLIANYDRDDVGTLNGQSGRSSLPRCDAPLAGSSARD